MSTLAIVIPAYNEEATLAATVEESLQAFEGDPRLTEVVVLDDLSTDGTRDVAGALAAREPRLRLLRNDRQMGCVPTVLRGFEAADAEFVFFLPADGQVRPADARRCLDVAEAGYDVVVTRRASRQDPWYRIALSAAYNRLIRLLVRNFPASDIDSSSLFRRITIAGLRRPEDATAFALVELLLGARRRGARITEIEIEHQPRAGGRAHGIRPREIVAGARGLALLLKWRLSNRTMS